MATRASRFGMPRTRAVLAQAAASGPDAGTLFDHPLLQVDVGGRAAFLEPDLITFQLNGRFHVVEIKSFAIIDGQADGGKVAAAVTQAAVYVLALRQLLKELGYGPETRRRRGRPGLPGELLQPGYLGARRHPQAADGPAPAAVPAGPHRHARRRDAPPDLSFDLAVDDYGVPQRPVGEIVEALHEIPSRYAPECLDACEMAYFCREESRDDTASLGRSVRDELGGIESIDAVLDLADGVRTPAPDQIEAADILRAAARLRRACLSGAA